MRLFTLLLTLSLATTIVAQDINFSQHALAPRLNPALTGALPRGSVRLATSYRNQWRPVLQDAAYYTYAASADGRFCTNSTGGFFTLGGSIVHDVSGSARLQTDEFGLNVGYHRTLGKRGREEIFLLQGGVGLEYINYRIDGSSLMFNDQFGINGFDPNLPTNEALLQENAGLLDLSAGVAFVWNDVFQNRDRPVTLSGGASYRHVFLPTFYFLDNLNLDENRLYSRILVHLGGDVPLQQYRSLRPKTVLQPRAIMQWQGQQWSSMLGSNFVFNFKQGWGVSFGLDVRLSSTDANTTEQGMVMDALIGSVGISRDEFELSVSYDVNASGLNRISRFNNALEISYTHYLSFNERCQFVGCPTL